MLYLQVAQHWVHVLSSTKISIRILIIFFTELDKTRSRNSHGSEKDTNSQNNLNQVNNGGDIIIPNFKVYHRSIVINTV